MIAPDMQQTSCRRTAFSIRLSFESSCVCTGVEELFGNRKRAPGLCVVVYVLTLSARFGVLNRQAERGRSLRPQCARWMQPLPQTLFHYTLLYSLCYTVLRHHVFGVSDKCGTARSPIRNVEIGISELKSRQRPSGLAFRVRFFGSYKYHGFSESLVLVTVSSRPIHCSPPAHDPSTRNPKV